MNTPGRVGNLEGYIHLTSRETAVRPPKRLRYNRWPILAGSCSPGFGGLGTIPGETLITTSPVEQVCSSSLKAIPEESPATTDLGSQVCVGRLETTLEESPTTKQIYSGGLETITKETAITISPAKQVGFGSLESIPEAPPATIGAVNQVCIRRPETIPEEFPTVIDPAKQVCFGGLKIIPEAPSTAESSDEVVPTANSLGICFRDEGRIPTSRAEKTDFCGVELEERCGLAWVGCDVLIGVVVSSVVFLPFVLFREPVWFVWAVYVWCSWIS